MIKVMKGLSWGSVQLLDTCLFDIHLNHPLATICANIRLQYSFLGNDVLIFI
ncbi:hypothetical protein XBJ2_1450019 [Xenorhabdus bovienii str. Jollieti]|uniref:Uncharacterized protein n=1 Tax=Xenorhabdus bovienii (strain SS-2004) TaxID=406818 RepID=D3V7Q6_XENBS|nr:hypothetical protein XBJ1_2744 [Xenorhabdus bovienii SS-2004]CDH27716.1 hypothetical protein XBJ2_1450019 [Xenorhabdus bovienii str. Jollieti]